MVVWHVILVMGFSRLLLKQTIQRVVDIFQRINNLAQVIHLTKLGKALAIFKMLRFLRQMIEVRPQLIYYALHVVMRFQQ